jgi:hypothetical protein
VLRAFGLEIVIPNGLPGVALVSLACIGATWLTLLVGRAIFVEPYHMERFAQSTISGLRGELATERTTRPILTITRAALGFGPLGSGIPILVVNFSIANPGPPTTFRDWELWIEPVNGESVGIRMTNVRFENDDDLGIRPLETGGRRNASYQGFHHSFDFSTMRMAGALFYVKTYDVRDREIKGCYTLVEDLPLPI